VGGIFFEGSALGKIQLAPLNREESDEFWRMCEHQLTDESTDEERVMRGSPHECLLYILRRSVSAQPSAETFDEESDNETEEPTEEEMEAMRRQR
jgi:hypothetical protein